MEQKWILGSLWISVAAAGCVLPFGLEGFQPTALVAGPQDQLVMSSAAGFLVFANLDDFTQQQDAQFSREAGNSDVRGLAMTSPQSTYLYLGAELNSRILEYEWHTSHKVFRSFHLLGLPHNGRGESPAPLGLQSLCFVPTPSAASEGYFYASTGISGDVYIYDVPLFSEGAEQSATSVKLWSPWSSMQHVRGLAYADEHLFVCYNMEDSARVMIFHVLASGMPGSLREQHQVDVVNVAGVAVRKASEDDWQLFFISKENRNIYGYGFRFLEGFRLHPYCTRDWSDRDSSQRLWANLALTMGFWSLFVA